MDLTSLWKTIINEIEVDLGKQQTRIYFKNSELKSFDNNIAKIALSNSAVVGTVNARYYALVKNALERQTKTTNTSLLFEVGEKKNASEKKLDGLFEEASADEVTKVAKDIIEKIQSTEPDFNYQKTHLAPKYNFKTFVVGSTNNFAYAAATGVIKNPGKEYNPFFIFGGVGVGKTHLMQAIGNELYQKNSSLKIMYTPAENFMNELIEAIKGKSTEVFKRKYRSLDVLLIDDVQFISEKESTQDEIFHTFNSLHQLEKQIILTSDRRPEEIERVQSRIISRFMGGLTVDIQSPDFETRVAILREKLENREEHWSNEIIEYIAASLESNIRELEGTLLNILTVAKVENQPVTLEFVKKQLGVEKIKSNKRKSAKVPPQTLISTVARQFGIKPGDLTSEKRDAVFVKPRQVAMLLLHKECGITLVEAAHLVGRKDHTTVMHAIDKIENLVKIDPQIRQNVMYIKKELWG